MGTIAATKMVACEVGRGARVAAGPLGRTGIGVADLGLRGIAVSLLAGDGSIATAYLDDEAADLFAGSLADVLVGRERVRAVAND